MSFYIALIAIIILFIRFFIGQGVQGYDWRDDTGDYFELWLRYLTLGATVLFIVSPKGFPLVIVITLTHSVTQMIRDQIFVKKFSSIKEMGKIQNICIDKAGVLTKNKITVTNVWNGKDNKVNPHNYKTDIEKCFPNKKTRSLFIQNCACNTVGDIDESSNTDQAFLEIMEKTGVDFNQLRSQHLPEPFMRFEYSERRKKMSTILQNITDNENGYDKRLHTKGDSETVLGL